jgi:hypothetical protein
MRHNGHRLPGEACLHLGAERLLRSCTLLDVAVKAGQVFPSHATIAKHAGCCERTVRNCLAWLRENGFLTWRRRLEWSPNEHGLRVPRQISNAYTVALL